jgi:hypothetical protein
MKIVLVLIILLGTPQGNDRPYELKGEAPGMTLKQFRANHRHAECSNRTASQTSCRVYDGVSFAGVAAMTYKGCTSLECSAQGIFADFVGDRLVYLSYGVNPGLSDQIVSALKKKFGEPIESTKRTTTWRNSVGYLSVSDMAVPGPGGTAKDLATSVTSSLNDRGESKDI